MQKTLLIVALFASVVTSYGEEGLTADSNVVNTEIPEVLAEVSGAPITRDDLFAVTSTIPNFEGIPNKLPIYMDVVAGLIRDKLVENNLETILEEDLGITDEDVDHVIALQKKEGSYDTRRGDLSEEEYKGLVRNSLQVDRWMWGPDAVPTEVDINAVLADEVPSMPKSFDVLHIQVSGEDAKGKLEALKARLDEGEDFETLAKELDPEALVAIRMPENMLPQASVLLEGAEVGQLIGPVQSAMGYHLFQLVNKVDAQPYDIQTSVLLAREIALQRIRDAYFLNKLNQLASDQKLLIFWPSPIIE